jgi:hypothetical protein
LWKLEIADFSQNAQLHARSLYALHQLQETVSSSSRIVVTGIAVAIARLKLKIPTTQQEPELASGILNKADSPLSLGVLDAKALGLDSDCCDHVRKRLLANNILALFSATFLRISRPLPTIAAKCQAIALCALRSSGVDEMQVKILLTGMHLSFG